MFRGEVNLLSMNFEVVELGEKWMDSDLIPPQAFVNTGVNLMLQFYPPTGPTDKVTKEYIDFEKDSARVRFIQIMQKWFL